MPKLISSFKNKLIIISDIVIENNTRSISISNNEIIIPNLLSIEYMTTKLFDDFFEEDEINIQKHKNIVLNIPFLVGAVIVTNISYTILATFKWQELFFHNDIRKCPLYKLSNDTYLNEYSICSICNSKKYAVYDYDSNNIYFIDDELNIIRNSFKKESHIFIHF